ncbi:hypothetical protein [Burkholderia vietnamiensis]|uniref:hypothetical protein n=1 Tax=Burkholderia vietnamiensis TaxID=60552 RepID=UPI001CF1F74F|nr:hypothetical protein [Burkholderia vietnamiensis]MCA8198896.1 hypothetical protein [Burkholderia vietnamiensis]
MNKTDFHAFRAELTIRARVSDALRAILLRYLPASKRPPYRIRLIPTARKTDRPSRGLAWLCVERRVAFVFWREIGACSYGDMCGAEMAISSDVIQRRAKRLRPAVVARADAAGKLLS